MKTIYLTSIVILLAYSNGTAQDWEHYYGQDNVYNIEKDVQEAYDKGYLLLGRISYEDNDDWIQPSWIIKTDINGNLLWDKILKNNDDGVFVNANDQCNDGGMVVCGSLRINNISYPFIVKLNACGEKEWCRRIPGALNDLPWAEDVKELPSGDIIMLVNMYGVYPDETMHLFKFDANGSMLWQQAYCSGFEYDASARPLGNRIDITQTNEIVISGYVYWEHPWEPGSGDKWLRPLIVMVDSSGNENWVLPFGLNDTIVGESRGFIELSDGNFIGIGAYKVFEGDYYDPLFMLFDKAGNELNHSVVVSSEISGLLQSGSFGEGAINGDTIFAGGLFGYGDDNIIMEAKFHMDDFEFTVQKAKLYYDNSTPYAFNTTFNNRFLSNSTFKEPYNWDIYLTKLDHDLEQDSIYTGSYTYDSLCPEAILSGFITLDDCFMTDIGEMPTPKEYYAHIASIPLKIYPNPASSTLNFELENTQFHSDIKLQVFDVNGKLMEEQPIAAGSDKASTDVGFWQSGMYAVVVLSSGKVVGSGKFVVR